MLSAAIDSAMDFIRAPLVYKGKVRELYDLKDYYLIVVTDRISAFDYVLRPAVPGKGDVLNRLSAFWFAMTRHLLPNHLVHTDVDRLAGILTEPELLKDRVMVVNKTERIGVECVVRGYITGGGWRQYVQTQSVNGIALPEGLRKNERFSEPLFTPAIKNDVGHDEDISFGQMSKQLGAKLADAVREASLNLYRFGHAYCERHGIIMADCKLEFGLLDGRLILIDELFTPDSARFWDKTKYELDVEIDSMDKEPVRGYLAGSDWDRLSEPDELPAEVVRETTRRYRNIYERLTSG